MFRFDLCLVLAAAAAPLGAQSVASRPSVVLIITDDLGYGDLGSFGAPDIKTPNIDRLAKEGVRLTDFYANAPLCTPTRAGLISGRYQQRAAMEHPLNSMTTAAGKPTAAAEEGLPATGRSLPQLLKNNGYATALIGKWHLGYKPEFSPNAHGFDYFFGFKSGYIDYYTHTDGAGRPDLFENAAPVEVTGYMTDVITDRSVSFITRNSGQPFFLEVAYNAGHWPYQRPDHPTKARDNAVHLHPYDDSTSTRADYVAMIERADRGVGEIVETLHRLGLTRNTLVIFTNDNGGEWLSRNAPLFHRKWTLWEGGIRVPTIVRWPGRIPAGRVSGQVGITMDLTASILAVTNTAVPADARLEGINLLPILAGETPPVERTLFWRSTIGGFNQHAVRVGDWKLLLDGTAAMVFNVRKDLGERNDVAADHPDIAARLHRLLTAWEADVDAEAKLRTGGVKP
jgi:arylsulfatase A-like enzyme